MHVWMCGCVDVWMCGCVENQKKSRENNEVSLDFLIFAQSSKLKAQSSKLKAISLSNLSPQDADVGSLRQLYLYILLGDQHQHIRPNNLISYHYVDA